LFECSPRVRKATRLSGGTIHINLVVRDLYLVSLALKIVNLFSTT